MAEIKLPRLGENIESATVAKIDVSPGSAVKKGQTILEIEAEKTNIELPAPEDGVVKKVLVKENEEIKVGQAVMDFDPSFPGATARPT